MYDNKKPTTVGGIPTGDMTESGNPTHNPDGTFGNEESVENKYGFDFDGSDTFDFLNNLNLDGAEEFDFLDDIDLNEQLETAIDRDYNSHLALKLGKEHYDKITDLVEQCENNNIIKFWKKYHEKIVISETNFKGLAYSEGISGSIHFDINKDSNGNDWFSPYKTFFHEGGHNIDRNLYTFGMGEYTTGVFGWGYSTNYKNGLFPKTINEEVTQLVNEINKKLKEEFETNKKNPEWLLENYLISEYTYRRIKEYGASFDYYVPEKWSKEFAYQKLEKETRNLMPKSRIDLRDILMGATYGKIGSGHKQKYWKDGNLGQGINENLAAEAFTEIFSSIIVQPESLEAIKKYLPKSYNIFEEMIENLVK